MNGSSRPAPPARAEALLHRWLPDGLLGLSMIGDLHQEYNELVEAGMGRAADRPPATTLPAPGFHGRRRHSGFRASAICRSTFELARAVAAARVLSFDFRGATNRQMNLCWEEERWRVSRKE